jgi:hypothetical protein
MKPIGVWHKIKFRMSVISSRTIISIFFLLFNVSQSFAHEAVNADSVIQGSRTEKKTRTILGGTITNNGYGGIILKFSRFNDQFAFMTGGRGACTINNRYTIGGGGYGIANSIRLSGSGEDTSRYFKMGYGGIELGYIILPGKKINLAGSLLVAAGASFLQNDPESDGEKLFDDDFKIFPVLEPSLYTELVLTKVIRLNAGISYRYIAKADLSYITNSDLRGFSFYIGLIFGKS